jgi:hypothetical protein
MGWLDTLIGAVGDIGVDIIAFLQYLIGLLVALFTYLYELLAAVFNFFYNLIVRIGQFFETLWVDFIKGVFQDIWSAIVKVHDWLENLLAPIINFLKMVQAYVQWFFNTYIKPFLNLISQVRSFLNLLRQFGIKWAAELDAWLGKVQADIIGAFQKLQGYINAIIGIVNSLADPLGLFRRPTFVMSMRRIFPSFMRGVSGMPLGYFFPSPLKNAMNGAGPTQFPFNISNPQQNPPPSGYLSGDDGLGNFGGWDGTDPLPDGTMDDMTAWDFFNDDNWPSPVNDDPAQAAQDAWQAQFGLTLFQG